MTMRMVGKVLKISQFVLNYTSSFFEVINRTNVMSILTLFMQPQYAESKEDGTLEKIMTRIAQALTPIPQNRQLRKENRRLLMKHEI